MQGEFKGDVTRDTFCPEKNFSRVLMQQGRVLLDADWNEQTSILLHYLRSLAADIIGEHGGPKDGFGFAIGVEPKPGESPPFGLTKLEWDKLKLKKDDFVIGKGHYYVGGILCENDDHLAFSLQPDNPGATPLSDTPRMKFLVYLDVWERHVSYLQDADTDNPNIREVALGGPDTATRARVVWQVKLKETDIRVEKARNGYPEFLAELGELIRPSTGRLRARARKPETDGEDCACVTSPESRYRGVENQLYRVEIHRSGVASNGGLKDEKSTGGAAATFKWSRENASVVFRIRKPVASGNGETTVALSDLGRDARFGLKEGDWVEIVDDDYILQNRAESLLRVHAINREECSVTLRGVPGSNVGQEVNKHPLLRRWDHRGGASKSGGLTIHKDGAALVQEGSGDNSWLHLEDGVQIQFQELKPSANYQTGDYWLIPARVATGNVEWPGPVNDPASLPPHGIEHHYAPLALIVIGTGSVTDLRRTFTPLTLL